MAEINVEALQRMFAAIADAMAKEKDRLCELDGVIGDADHGIAMELGFSAASKAVAALEAGSNEPSLVFNTAAKAFLNAVGASSGPLYATAFMRAAAAVKGKAILSDEDFIEAFIAMAKGIQDRGKAELGEKTMIDAWDRLPKPAKRHEWLARGCPNASALRCKRPRKARRTPKRWSPPKAGHRGLAIDRSATWTRARLPLSCSLA